MTRSNEEIADDLDNLIPFYRSDGSVLDEAAAALREAESRLADWEERALSDATAIALWKHRAEAAESRLAALHDLLKEN